MDKDKACDDQTFACWSLAKALLALATRISNSRLHTDVDAKREEELEDLLGVVDGMDLDGSKRVRRPTVLDLKSAVEAAEQQNAKRLKAGSLDTPELQHTESQPAPLPHHYYDEPDPAK